MISTVVNQSPRPRRRSAALFPNVAIIAFLCVLSRLLPAAGATQLQRASGRASFVTLMRRRESSHTPSLGSSMPPVSSEMSKRSHTTHVDPCRRLRPLSAFALPNDLSSLSLSPTTLISTASAALTYIGLVAFYDRPRGTLNTSLPPDALAIRQSNVPGAGLGLFATQSLPSGTPLGTYPGVLRPARQFYEGKCRNYPNAVYYSWRFTDDAYAMDPTDETGEIVDFSRGGSSAVPLSNAIFKTVLSFWTVNTMLARINEPPIGAGGCNVQAKQDKEKRTVLFTLCKDVVAGEEFFMDYGLDYDRTNYGP